MKSVHFFTSLFLLASLTEMSTANAAIALDRTRIIFDGSKKSVSLTVSNSNKQLPYLAQGWIEDENGKKLQGPMTVLPPVQRIEAGSRSQVKIQALPATASLPQDRETLFYFNLREIPPRSKEPNTLQIALQTRIKLLYRPQALARASGVVPEEQIELAREGSGYTVINPTPYYVTLVKARASSSKNRNADFTPLMVAPKSRAQLNINLGESPVLTYLNDYGGRPELFFNCEGSVCKTSPDKKS